MKINDHDPERRTNPSTRTRSTDVDGDDTATILELIHINRTFIVLGYCIVDRYFIAAFGSTVCMCLSSTIPDVEQQQQCRRIGYRTTAGDGIHFRWCRSFDLSPERYLTTTRAIQLRAFVVNGGQLPTIAASGINSYLHLHNKSFCVTCVDRLCRGHENARNY